MKTMNTPTLRFKEFSGAWEVKELEDVADRIIVGLATTVTDFYVEKSPVSIPIIRNMNIKNGYFDDSDMLYLNPEFAALHKNKRVKFEDVISVHTGSNVGLTCVVPKAYDNSHTFTTLIVTTKKNVISPYYLNYLIGSAKGQYQILRLVVGGGKGNLNTNDFKIYPVTYPTLPEQTKIANFLTAIDEKIAQLSQTAQLLTDYKKGVMQQIFSQQLRFKDDDGREFAEWEEKKLSDIGDSFNGLVGKSGDDFGSGKGYITYKQIFDNSKIDVTKFSFVQIDEDEKQNEVKFGDVFFTTSSETPNEVGFCSVLLSQVEDVYLNSFCFGYRIKSFDLFSPYFASYLFRSSDFRTDVIVLAQGSTRFNISKTGFMKIKIKLPCVKEQTKIANFLTAIDDKINHNQTQLDAMKQYKSGLLQQMFV